MNKRVLVVAAHADDEVLGCGGTIARHVDEGDCVSVVYMADGVGSRGAEGSDELQRRNEARDEALKTLGVTDCYALDFPDNRMDSLPLLDVVQSLEPIFEKLRPTQVYTHHQGDLNVDHRVTHQAVMTACRPLPGRSVNEILTFEVMSSTEWATHGVSHFVPNTFINISSYLDLKIRALNAYQMELREWPNSRSLLHLKLLAQHRGATVGIDAAEAFQLERLIKD
jgi:LmbE family N-acetylglucosaminyl deacetylase